MLTALAAPGLELPASRQAPPAYAYRAACRLSVMPSGAPTSDSRDELLATIRVWEGEPMEQPPLLFKLVVALGSAMLGGAGLLIIGLAV